MKRETKNMIRKERVGRGGREERETKTERNTGKEASPNSRITSQHLGDVTEWGQDERHETP